VLTGVVIVAGAFVFRPAPGPPQRKTVVVELFTSEGCSSCPPADELLTLLGQSQSSNGVAIIPLGFHVDYWNSLGWQDRFSSRNFSERQEQYARKFKIDGPYTPQMVVDGNNEFVGNSSGRAQTIIAEAATRAQKADIQISAGTADKLLVRVDPVGNAAPADVMLAVTEDNLTSKIGAGENDGRVLRHSAVVRDFRRLGHFEKSSFETSVSVHLDKEWKPDNLHVVVFVQTADRGAIEGAVSTPWNSLSRAH
jgi:hypothetical protein